jgi:dTDP-4-amino-4,6-dideoxygalactose transaminase
MHELVALAQRRGLKLLEDVAQAVGGSFHGQRLGSIGDVGAFSFQFNKIITCGEGGIAITKDSELHRRIIMYHDGGAAQRYKISKEDMLNGLNYRMSELHGALMLIQLARLQGLLKDMRERKAVVKDALADVARRKEVSFRTINDPNGDAAISLIFLVPTAERAGPIAAALNAEGARASVIYEPSRVDYHVYADWAPILERRLWSEHGGPWRWHDGEVGYSKDMCPQSLALLGRTIHLDISPDMSRDDVGSLSEAVIKVLEVLL